MKKKRINKRTEIVFRVTSRDVESLVDSRSISPRIRQPRPPNSPSARLQKSEYQNVVAEEQSDAERNARQHALRKTVATASLQIVLLSKALLNHVGLHANDPLGTLLHHKRVLGLFLGVNESKDVMPLHRSGNLLNIGMCLSQWYSSTYLFP